jgi:hypothetical protein
MSRNAGDGKEKKARAFFFLTWPCLGLGLGNNRGHAGTRVGENYRPGGVGYRIRRQGDLGSWSGRAKGGTETRRRTNDAVKSLGE